MRVEVKDSVATVIFQNPFRHYEELKEAMKDYEASIKLSLSSERVSNITALNNTVQTLYFIHIHM